MPRVVAEVHTGIEPRMEGKDWSWKGWLPKGRIRHFLRLSRCPVARAKASPIYHVVGLQESRKTAAP